MGGRELSLLPGMKADCMRIAAIPGSYDPVTLGHVDIIRRAARLYDRVYVVAMDNADKTHWLAPEQRLALLQAATAGLDNVVAEYNGGYFYAYAAARSVTAIVKGVRSAADVSYELEIARFNRAHLSTAETLLMPADPALEGISSGLVRARWREGLEVSGLVPAQCEDMLKKWLPPGTGSRL